MTTVPAKQRVLVRTLYRNLLRETNRIPGNASLQHLDQWVDDTRIEDQDTLRSCIRSAFRRTEEKLQARQRHEHKRRSERDSAAVKDDIQRAIEGLRLIHSLDMDQLPKINRSSSLSHEELETAASTRSNPLDWLDSVEWLPPISEMTNVSSPDSEPDEVEFAVFPLAGPVFVDEDRRLPLVTQFSDVPVAGMEIPLNIFEPRYRQMYRDLLTAPTSTPSSKRFIVPFSHPSRMGQFASWAWLYEIVRVQDVADETNGRYQLVCNHLVSKPVKITSIVNPSDFETRATYLRAHAQIVDAAEDIKSSDSLSNLKPLDDLLRLLQQNATIPSSPYTSAEKSLIDRLLMAMAEGSIWPVVQVWISNLQMLILEIQVRVANKIQLQSNNPGNTRTNPENRVNEDMITLAQEPHKKDLESMLMEVSTLIPLLLQDGCEKSQCQRLCQRIQERLGAKAGKSSFET